MKKAMIVILAIILALPISVSASTSNTTPEEIRRNNEIQANQQYQMLLANLAELSAVNARSTTVDYYGGAYINDDGNLVVCVTDYYDQDSNLIESFTDNDDIVLQTVDYTYAALSEEQDRIWATKELLKAKYDELDSDTADVVDSLVQSYVVQSRNTLVIAIKNITQGKIDIFKAVFSNAAFLEFEDGLNYEETATEWKAGRRICTARGRMFSSGYPVYFKNDNGEIELGFMTVGHPCEVGDLIYTNFTYNTVVGVCIRKVSSGNVDAALIQVTNPSYQVSRKTYYNEDDEVILDMHSYTALPGENSTIHTEGFSSEHQVGVVVSTNTVYNDTGITVRNMVLTTNLCLDGDSGGVAYTSGFSIVGCMVSAIYEGNYLTAATHQYTVITRVEDCIEALDCQIWPCDGEDCEIDDCIHLNH